MFQIQGVVAFFDDPKSCQRQLDLSAMFFPAQDNSWLEILHVKEEIHLQMLEFSSYCFAEGMCFV